MDFSLVMMEVEKRRNKLDKPCIEEKVDYDKSIIGQYVSNIGCRPPYLDAKHNLPLCSTNQDMFKARFPLSQTTIDKYPPPCKAAEKVYFNYRDAPHTSGRGTFWFGIFTYPATF